MGGTPPHLPLLLSQGHHSRNSSSSLLSNSPGKPSQGLPLRTQMLSAISVSTGCYITWQPPDSEPWGNSGWSQTARCQAQWTISCCGYPWRCTWGDARWENRGCWPQRAKVHIKGVNSVSPDSYLLLHRKALNSLIWDVWYFLIKTDHLVFCYKNFCVSLLAPLPLWSSIWELFCVAVSWAWSLKKVHWIKHNSQQLGCAFFFFFSENILK